MIIITIAMLCDWICCGRKVG